MATNYLNDRIEIIPSNSEAIRECQFEGTNSQEQSNFYVRNKYEIREFLKIEEGNDGIKYLDGECYVNTTTFQMYFNDIESKLLPFKNIFKGKLENINYYMKKVLVANGMIPKLYFTGTNNKYLSFDNQNDVVEALRHLIFPKITHISIRKINSKYELSFNLIKNVIDYLYEKQEIDLVNVLKSYYDRDKKTGIHLFGFDYAHILDDHNVTIKKIIEDAGISGSYDTEVHNGKKFRYKLEQLGYLNSECDVILFEGEKNKELDIKDETRIKPINYKTGVISSFSANRILFGAPGTGKSFTLNKEKDNLLTNNKNYERVTFHPDYSYANFVGTYKPVSVYNEEIKKKEIDYKYVPGPFMRTLVKALKSGKGDNPEIYLLIIEEINRANVAAVFGDVFQLLDRKDGVSEYPIQTSEDMRQYLVDELGGEPDAYAEIRLPDNMYIWATMNSADQGVYPMDTAFKRRWDFTYIGIDDAEDEIENETVNLNGNIYKWNSIRKGINDNLSKMNINEDKLLGPFFINMDKIENEKEFNDIFKDKVLMYLYEDAGRQRRSKIFKENLKVYSSICKEYDENKLNIFIDDILKTIDDYNEDKKG